MNWRFRFTPTLLTIVGFAMAISLTMAAEPIFAAEKEAKISIDREPLFNWHALQGIDTIIVFTEYGPNAALLPTYIHHFTQNDVHSLFQNPSADSATVAIRQLFSKQPWITVKQWSPTRSQEPFKSNVLSLTVSLSARQEIVDGKAFNVGAVAVQLHKDLQEDVKSSLDPFLIPSIPISAVATTVQTTHVIPISPVSYPFAIPVTSDAAQHAIADGVRYLLSYLPSYFVCAHKGDDCKISLPYEEK
jgi:hypothetical protein